MDETVDIQAQTGRALVDWTNIYYSTLHVAGIHEAGMMKLVKQTRETEAYCSTARVAQSHFVVINVVNLSKIISALVHQW